jgi:hypothetical protein
MPAMALTQTSRLSSRRARLCIIAAVVLLPIGQIGLIIRPWPLSSAMELALAVIFWSAMAFLAAVVTGVPGYRREAKGALDEREAVETANALSLSYRIMAFLLLALTLWYALATRGNSFGLAESSSSMVVLLLVNLFWLHLMLPGMILVWRERPISDDR